MSYQTRARKKPVQRRGEERVEALVAAARELAGEMSPDEITTNRIAMRAGVNIGTLYHFFSNKYEIFVAVLSTVYAEFEQVLRDALRERPASARDWARVLVDLHVQYWRPNFNAMLVWRRYRFRPELNRIDAEYFSRVDAIMLDGLSHYLPALSPARRRTVATLLTYTCGELVDELAMLENEQKQRAWRREIEAIVVGYLEEISRADA